MSLFYKTNNNFVSLFSWGDNMCLSHQVTVKADVRSSGFLLFLHSFEWGFLFLSLQCFGRLSLNCRCRCLQCTPGPQLFREMCCMGKILCSSGFGERIRAGISWAFWEDGVEGSPKSKLHPHARNADFHSFSWNHTVYILCATCHEAILWLHLSVILTCHFLTYQVHFQPGLVRYMWDYAQVL